MSQEKAVLQPVDAERSARISPREVSVSPKEQAVRRTEIARGERETPDQAIEIQRDQIGFRVAVQETAAIAEIARIRLATTVTFVRVRKTLLGRGSVAVVVTIVISTHDAGGSDIPHVAFNTPAIPDTQLQQHQTNQSQRRPGGRAGKESGSRGKSGEKHGQMRSGARCSRNPRKNGQVR